MAWDVLVQQWWVQVTAGIVVGLVVAGVLAVLSKKFRSRVWAPVGRALRWPLTLRVTTSIRQRALADELTRQTVEAEQAKARFKEICDLLGAPAVMMNSTGAEERIAQLREAKEAAWAHARKEIEAAKSLAQRELAEEARRGAELAETARELGRTEGHAHAMAEVEAQRARPELKPTWRVVEMADGHFKLRNSQSGMNALDISYVSLEAPMLDFAFDGSNQWPGHFPGEMDFEGRRIGRMSIRFMVRWQDRRGDHHAGEAVLEGKRRRATVL
jgi:hypothetical protein